MASQKAQKNLFIRETSGLVREISPWSSMLATFALVTGGVPILILSWLYLSPGVNWTIPFLITSLPTMGMGFLFYVATVSTPRSGGDYVFNSRAFNPVVGFVNYWGLFIGFAFSLGYYSYLGASWFGYLLSSLGMAYNDTGLLNIAGWFQSTSGSVIVGAVIIIISTLIIMSNRVNWNFILVSGIVTWVATIIMFGVLATITPNEFSTSLSSYTGIPNAYSEVINDAQSNGLSFLGDGLIPSLTAVPLIWYYYTWYNLPASWSGEMRKVKYNALLSIIVAIMLITVYYILFTDLNLRAFGENFLTSWSYINANGLNDTVYNNLSAIGDFTPFFAYLVNHNLPLLIIMWIAIWLPNFYSNPPLIVALTRYLFAWSFDRIFPQWMADVNDKLHIPVKATVLVGGLGVLGMLMYAYIPVVAVVDITIVFEIGYAIFALSTALVPFIRKEMFSQIGFRKRIGKIPVISLVGFPVFAFLMFALYESLGNSVILPINEPTLASLAIIYGSGISIYFIAKELNKRRGIDLELLFKEIPPE